MRCIKCSWVVVVGGLLALPSAAQAQQNDDENGDAPRRPALRERVLRAFDEDGDGRLNDQEREAVRRQLGERLGEVREQVRETREQRSEGREGEARRRRADAESRREGGPARDTERGEAGRRSPDREGRSEAAPETEGDRSPDRDRSPEARGRAERDRRPEGARRSAEERRDREARESLREERRIRVQLDPAGPGRPRGPVGPTGGLERDLQPLFGWFDIDGDNLLSRREFAELSQFVERRRPGTPDGPPGGPRVGRRDREGAAPALGGGFRGFGGGGFRGFPDRARRVEGPPRGDRPNRGDRGSDRPPRPTRPDGPPDRPAGPELAPPDAI